MPEALRVVVAQVNLMVGDIDGNTALVLKFANEAIQQQGTDVIAFPELTLTGYPPEDLLLRPSLPSRIEKALNTLCAANLPITIVLGYPLMEQGKLYNALGVISSGRLLGVYRKQSLPNYQVFDERRYFDPGSEALVLAIDGFNVGFTICEDLWEEQPTRMARAAGAQCIININASPYDHGKVEQRRKLLAQRCSENELAIIYVNLVGGQDELIFDGGSLACNQQGEVVALSPRFDEALTPVELVRENAAVVIRGELEIPSVETSLEAETYRALVLCVRDYVNKNGFKGVVLGLSGGIDSALTLAIAVDALGAERVEAVMMPFEYTSQLSLSAAAEQAANLAVGYSVIPISAQYQAFVDGLAEEFSGREIDVTEQNIQARCRGVILMAISNKKGVLVLTTGNKSEVAVGYSTLYGDMAGGFDVLKDVPKTLVYRLANYRNQQRSEGEPERIPQSVIDRPPSAELAPDQVDQDSLPPYEVLDAILEMYVEQDMSAQAIIQSGFSADQVNRVLRLVDLNEYKRRQSPIGPRLTQRGFGRDRRYPITNGWPLGE